MSIWLDANQEALVDQMRKRHEHRSTLCGALLSEIGSSSAGIESRTLAARMFGYVRCRRGLKVLEVAVASVRSDLEESFPEVDAFPVGPARYLLNAILFAVARSDTDASHSLLVKLFFSFDNIHLRADALEAMAFESETYDRQFVSQLLEVETPEPILLSALYATRLQNTCLVCEAVRRQVVALLDHDQESVRVYAAEALDVLN